VIDRPSRQQRQDYLLAASAMDDAVNDFACSAQLLARRQELAGELARHALELGRLLSEHRRLMLSVFEEYDELVRKTEPDLAPVIDLRTRERRRA
jgi:uncharacterized protein Yka (UPF0111/DUF47 family)